MLAVPLNVGVPVFVVEPLAGAVSDTTGVLVSVNVTVTDWSEELALRMQVVAVVDEHPVNDVKTDPESGASVSVTAVVVLMLLLHVVPVPPAHQLPVEPVIVPKPVPANVTVILRFAAATYGPTTGPPPG